MAADHGALFLFGVLRRIASWNVSQHPIMGSSRLVFHEGRRSSQLPSPGETQLEETGLGVEKFRLIRPADGHTGHGMLTAATEARTQSAVISQLK